MIYFLSCETIQHNGGIYAFEIEESGLLKRKKYYPCDRPMYAVKSKNGLSVLLRCVFEKDGMGGYFFIDENLQNATETISTKGIVPCHLSVKNGDIYVVNYLSGNVVKNGKEIVQRKGNSVNPTRQNEPHTHFVDFASDGYLAVCDLGTDTLAFYDKDLRLISETKVPSGYGIRHLVFSKDGSFIYAVNELVPSVSVFEYSNGKARIVKTEKISCQNRNASGAAIRLSENGKFLYVSLRGENAVCVFRVKGNEVQLIQKADCGGDEPRDFDLLDDKIVVCNQKSGNVKVFDMRDGFIGKIKSEARIDTVLCVVK